MAPTVLITGGTGNLGTKLRRHFEAPRKILYTGTPRGAGDVENLFLAMRLSAAQDSSNRAKALEFHHGCHSGYAASMTEITSRRARPQ